MNNIKRNNSDYFYLDETSRFARGASLFSQRVALTSLVVTALWVGGALPEGSMKWAVGAAGLYSLRKVGQLDERD